MRPGKGCSLHELMMEGANWLAALAADRDQLAQDLALAKAAHGANSRIRRRLRRVNHYDDAKSADALSKKLQIAHAENRELAARLAEAQTQAFTPTHRHVKRGSVYAKVGEGKMQTDKPLGDYAAVVVYRAEDVTIWVRPVEEFTDGRFVELAKAISP
jgi:hypothetical protein